MVPSTFFGLNWPIAPDDSMTARPGNRASRCKDWQFGLLKIRVAEPAGRFSAICARFRKARHNTSRAMTPRPMMQCTTVQRHHTIREVLLPQ
jgi:hypothetical protein